jgi:hypothetical protein
MLLSDVNDAWMRPENLWPVIGAVLLVFTALAAWSYFRKESRRSGPLVCPYCSFEVAPQARLQGQTFRCSRCGSSSKAVGVAPQAVGPAMAIIVIGGIVAILAMRGCLAGH